MPAAADNLTCPLELSLNRFTIFILCQRICSIGLALDLLDLLGPGVIVRDRDLRRRNARRRRMGCQRGDAGRDAKEENRENHGRTRRLVRRDARLAALAPESSSGEKRARRRPTWKAMMTWRSEDEGPRAVAVTCRIGPSRCFHERFSRLGDVALRSENETMTPTTSNVPGRHTPGKGVARRPRAPRCLPRPRARPVWW